MVQGKTTACKPGREASGDAALLTPWSQTSGLQNWEKTNVCCLSPEFTALSYGGPNRPMEKPTAGSALRGGEKGSTGFSTGLTWPGAWHTVSAP